MTSEEFQVQCAAYRAADALNECVAVFVDLAKIGQYPEALMGRGWIFATNARDELKDALAAWRAIQAANEPPEDFGPDPMAAHMEAI
jgi:hypothetical protein